MAYQVLNTSYQGETWPIKYWTPAIKEKHGLSSIEHWLSRRNMAYQVLNTRYQGETWPIKYWTLENLVQGSHFSTDMKFYVFSRLFQCKSNEIPGQCVYVDKVDMRKMYLNDFSVNDILKIESSNTEFTHIKFFSRFSVKIPGFSKFLSRHFPGLEK